MKQSERIISGLQQDIKLPDIVIQKADAAFDRILSEKGKETEKRSISDKKNKSTTRRKYITGWGKGMAAAAAILMITFGFCAANPVLAAKIPVVGHLFAMLQEKVTYPGNYTDYAQPLEDGTADTLPGQEGKEESSVYTRIVNGVTVTISEVYCNQEALNLTLMIEGKEPFRDKILADQSGKQFLFLDMESVFSFRPAVYVGNGKLEGSFIDDRTFAGIWRMDMQEVLTDTTAIDEMAREAEAEGREFVITEEILKQYGKPVSLPEQFNVDIHLKTIIGELAEQKSIDWGMSTEELEALSDEELKALYDRICTQYGINEYPNSLQNYWMDGPWDFTVPVRVNDADNRTVIINDMNEEGAGLQSVTVTPFEIRLNMFSGENSGKDYFPVVLDADGKWMDPEEGDVSGIPVAGHDVSRIYVFLCDEQRYMDEIKGYRGQDNFRQILEEQADYAKEVDLVE